MQSKKQDVLESNACRVPDDNTFAGSEGHVSGHVLIEDRQTL